MGSKEKSAVKKWMYQFDGYITHAVTITFKQSVVYGFGHLESPNNYYKQITELSSSHAEGKANIDNLWVNFEKYTKFINRTVLTKSAIRNDESIIIIPAVHGFDDNSDESGMMLWHLHLAIGIGNASGVRKNEFTYNDMAKVIRKASRKAGWANNVTDVQPYLDTGWLGYMMKEESSNKHDICASFVKNSRLPLSLRSSQVRI
jgi:hypothetical protein